MSIASFAFVGVEILAASVLEARPRRHGANPNYSREGLGITTIRFSSAYMPLLVGVAYIIGGIVLSLCIHRGDKRLSTPSWLKNEQSGTRRDSEEKGIIYDTDISAFVVIAERTDVPGLCHAFNGFLVFTAVTAASTHLYVASRTLFGLTSRLEGGPGQPWYLRVFAGLGRTNKRMAPKRAIVFSAAAFSWVPFLHLKGEDGVKKVRTLRSFNSLQSSHAIVYRGVGFYGVCWYVHSVGNCVPSVHSIL